MPPFPEPKFAYDYDVHAEVQALRDHRDTAPDRQIPSRADNRLVLATWNIANLGVQNRLDTDYDLIAELLGWFDLVAVQEVNDNLRGIQAIHQRLPASYRLVFSDASGNRERQAFLYDSNRVRQLEEIGRLSIPPSDLEKVAPPGVKTPFAGFDRGPYLATFEAGDFRFMLVNVHLYFGADDPAHLDRRTLETFAVAWWAGRHHRDAHTYVPDIVPLGDFNLPKTQPGDPIYDALRARGLEVPPHTSQIGSSIANDSQYDQIAFFPGDTHDHFTGRMNVFDVDNALFRDLFQKRGRNDFLAYMRFHISDHRPLWAEFRTG